MIGSGRLFLLGAGIGFVVGCGEPIGTACEPLVLGARVVGEDTLGDWRGQGLEPSLVELWRRGGTNPGEELAFPIFPAVSGNGRLAIPDFQLGEVIVIEPDGRWSGAWTRSGQGPGGVLALGATDGTYRIMVSDEAGEPVHQICRRADVAPLSAAERGYSMPDGLERLATALRDAPRPPSPAPFGRIVVGARGRIWVQRTRPPPFPGDGASLHGQPGARHAVFGLDGRYLGEVRMPAGAALQAAMGETIWAFRVGEFDEVWVVAFALEFASRSRGGV